VAMPGRSQDVVAAHIAPKLFCKPDNRCHCMFVSNCAGVDQCPVSGLSDLLTLIGTIKVALI